MLLARMDRSPFPLTVPAADAHAYVERALSSVRSSGTPLGARHAVDLPSRAGGQPVDVSQCAALVRHLLMTVSVPCRVLELVQVRTHTVAAVNAHAVAYRLARVPLRCPPHVPDGAAAYLAFAAEETAPRRVTTDDLCLPPGAFVTCPTGLAASDVGRLAHGTGAYRLSAGAVSGRLTLVLAVRHADETATCGVTARDDGVVSFRLTGSATLDAVVRRVRDAWLSRLGSETDTPSLPRVALPASTMPAQRRGRDSSGEHGSVRLDMLATRPEFVWVAVPPRAEWADLADAPRVQEAQLLELSLEAQLTDCKNRLDTLTPAQRKRGKAVCNPFERLGNQIFINRAAMKMVELDAVFELLPGAVARAVGGTVRIGDFAAGPGGFSEYFLWRVQQQNQRRGAEPVSLSITGVTLRGETPVLAPRRLTGLQARTTSRRRASTRDRRRAAASRPCTVRRTRETLPTPRSPTR